MLGISILSYNHWDLTKQMLDSLVKSLDHPSIVCIFDDGSDEETRSKIIGYCLASRSPFILQVKYIFTEENIGLIQGRNKTYEFLLGTAAKYIAILHNDMQFETGMFSKLIKAIPEDCAIIGAETFRELPEDLDKAAEMNRFDEYYRGNNHPAIMRVLAMKETLENGKVYDESFGRCDNEDIDLLGRFEYAGWKTLVTKKAWAYHKGEVTRSLNPDTAKWKHYSRHYYEMKWRNKGKKGWDHMKKEDIPVKY